MNSEQMRLEDKARWYRSEQLSIDKKMIFFRYEAIKPFLKGPSGLELGPAEGEMTQFLISDFEKLTVVDGARELLDSIPDFPNLTKIQSIFETFQPQEPFDTIILDHILEHVEEPVGLLQRCKPWLAAGGRMIIGVPNAHSIHRLVGVKMSLLPHPSALNERDLALGHRRVYAMETLRHDLLRGGLKIIQTGGVFFKPLSFKQIEEQWSEAMIQAFVELGKDFPEHCADLYAVCEGIST